MLKAKVCIMEREQMSAILESKHPQRKQLLAMPESLESFPFGEQTAVYKVREKVFGLFFLDFQGHPGMNLKCDPDQALALRDVFESIIPGYHMNKKHWNTVILDGSVPEEELKRLIDHSYAQVVRGFTKKEQAAMRALYGEGIFQA